MDRTTVAESISNMDSPWMKTKEEVIDYYKVDEDIGLSEERIRHDFEKYGHNGNI